MKLWVSCGVHPASGQEGPFPSAHFRPPPPNAEVSLSCLTGIAHHVADPTDPFLTRQPPSASTSLQPLHPTARAIDKVAPASPPAATSAHSARLDLLSLLGESAAAAPGDGRTPLRALPTKPVGQHARQSALSSLRKECADCRRRLRTFGGSRGAYPG